MDYLVHIEINKHLAPIKTQKNSPVLFLDYDQTLVHPKDGRPFSKEIDDWQWMFPTIPSMISKMYHDGYKIVICTNQTKPWKCTQIETALSTITDVKMDICIGMDKSVHKPSIVMLRLLSWFEKKNMDLSSSMFVGDALGRKHDHSDCDKVFAQLLGIPYIEPELFFDTSTSLNKLVPVITPSDHPEVIIMVGYPGSGKSTVALQLVEQHPSYNYISGDICKTSVKMISTAKKIMTEHKASIIFDATNPTIEKRSEYIAFAKEYNYTVRCVYMTSSYEESKRRNMHRQDEKKVPSIVYNVYRKKFQEPTEAEGFTLLTLS